MTAFFHILPVILICSTHTSYQMVDNKSETSLIRHIEKNISLMKINNVIFILRIRIILSSSFVIIFFCMSFGKSYNFITVYQLKYK